MLGGIGFARIAVGVVDQGDRKLYRAGRLLERAGSCQGELVVAAATRVGHHDGEYIVIHRGRVQRERIRRAVLPAKDYRDHRPRRRRTLVTKQLAANSARAAVSNVRGKRYMQKEPSARSIPQIGARGRPLEDAVVAMAALLESYPPLGGGAPRERRMVAEVGGRYMALMMLQAMRPPAPPIGWERWSSGFS